MSKALADQAQHACAGLPDVGKRIVGEELTILATVQQRLARDSASGPEVIEDLDAQLIELRDAIGEAKEEDVASLVDQMHQVAALSRRRGQSRAAPIDPENPYFGHLRLREARSGRTRDVLVGRHTLLDDGNGLTIVDWRNAPVSRLYYRYDEGDDYEEDFDDRTLEGKVLVRRSVAVAQRELRRVATPQGTFALDRQGQWRETVGSAKPTLAGGSGSAIRVKKGQLGVHGDDGQLRADKHLQEITALIDRQQFELITRPESGVVLIQGGAGSGKTTVALHRVAYLAFHDPARFRVDKMLVVVFNDGLVEYIRHVLPSLGVEGVPVTTYRRWSSHVLARVKLKTAEGHDLPIRHTQDAPEAVARWKKHPMVLGMLQAIVDAQQEELYAQLVERCQTHEGWRDVQQSWQRMADLPPVFRVQRMLQWLQSGNGMQVAPKVRAAAQGVLEQANETVGDVVADWLEFNTGRARIEAAVAAHGGDAFRPHEVDSIVRWCARKADFEAELEREDGEPLSDDNPGTMLDPEDDAILLRLVQLKFGGIFVGGKRFEYEHVVVDEAQDLCPLEVRVLLDCVSRGSSVTIAGDRAQKMVFDNGFTDWPELLRDAGLPHTEVQPLQVTYRSTRQVMAFSRAVLGPLDTNESIVARDGAPVSYFEFGDTGEAVAFLGEALRGLMLREPSASVAVIARYPQQADLYFDALQLAEVPKVRRVRREDFSFSAGIDVTDVRQVKGLEFDYVVIVDPTRQNYPNEVQARHLMHIAATRAAFQLWLVCAGNRSPLLPADLVNAAEQ